MLASPTLSRRSGSSVGAEPVRIFGRANAEPPKAESAGLPGEVGGRGCRTGSARLLVELTGPPLCRATPSIPRPLNCSGRSGLIPSGGRPLAFAFAVALVAPGATNLTIGPGAVRSPRSGCHHCCNRGMPWSLRSWQSRAVSAGLLLLTQLWRECFDSCVDSPLLERFETPQSNTTARGSARLATRHGELSTRQSAVPAGRPLTALLGVRRAAGSPPMFSGSTIATPQHDDLSLVQHDTLSRAVSVHSTAHPRRPGPMHVALCSWCGVRCGPRPVWGPTSHKCPLASTVIGHAGSFVRRHNGQESSAEVSP